MTTKEWTHEMRQAVDAAYAMAAFLGHRVEYPWYFSTVREAQGLVKTFWNYCVHCRMGIWIVQEASPRLGETWGNAVEHVCARREEWR